MRGRCLNLRVLLVLLCFSACEVRWAGALQSRPSETGAADKPATVTLESGTKIELALIIPVWAKTAKPGDPLYTQTNYPVTAGDAVAIPAGTFVEGRIESVTRPTRRLGQAELQILFTKIIFANGYAIVLPDAETAAIASAQTAAKITIKLSTSNDLLLDNGAQIEMTLGAPLEMNRSAVASAIPLARAPEPGKFKSATLCRFIAGTPGTSGTSDTVIPGSSGTPSTTIPGGPGMPDITIPGSPATPDTVISGTPGTPGTPDIFCPAAPIVISSVPIDTMPARNQSSAPSTTH